MRSPRKVFAVTVVATSSLVVLIGAPASGKSTWAAENFSPEQIVSSDELRGVVGEHRLDLAATEDVFAIMDQVIAMRLGRKLTTVVDTTGLDEKRRAIYLDLAAQHGVDAVAVRFTTSAAECRRRNRERAHPVPAKALDDMVKLAKTVDLDEENWAAVLEPKPVRTVTKKLAAAVEANPPSASATSLRFGLLLSRYNWPTEEIGPRLAHIAQEAEKAGFDSLWVMDHMMQIPQVGSAWDPMLESYTTLGFMANATSTIRLGVLVSGVMFRNVGHLAKLVATLDVLSGGRAVAGLGAANFEREHDAYGWSFPSAPERLARLEDALQALPLLWGPGGPAFTGETLSIPDTTSYPRPIQDPPPIIVGGSGERVTLRLAAQYADGCNLFGDADAVRRLVGVLHDHCDSVGRDPAEVEITHLGEILLAADRAALRQQLDQLRPSNLGPDRFAERVNAGTLDDHEAGFHALAAAGVGTAIVTTQADPNTEMFENYAELIGRFR